MTSLCSFFLPAFYLLTILNTHQPILHEFQARWTSTRYSRTSIGYFWCWQAEMRAVSVDRLTEVFTIRLTVGMIDVNCHWILKLKRRQKKRIRSMDVVSCSSREHMCGLPTMRTHSHLQLFHSPYVTLSPAPHFCH